MTPWLLVPVLLAMAAMVMACLGLYFHFTGSRRSGRVPAEYTNPVLPPVKPVTARRVGDDTPAQRLRHAGLLPAGCVEMVVRDKFAAPCVIEYRCHMTPSILAALSTPVPKDGSP